MHPHSPPRNLEGHLTGAPQPWTGGQTAEALTWSQLGPLPVSPPAPAAEGKLAGSWLGREERCDAPGAAEGLINRDPVPLLLLGVGTTPQEGPRGPSVNTACENLLISLIFNWDSVTPEVPQSVDQRMLSTACRAAAWRRPHRARPRRRQLPPGRTRAQGPNAPHSSLRTHQALTPASPISRAVAVR